MWIPLQKTLQRSQISPITNSNILNHCAELLRLVEGQPELKETPAVQTIDRFLKEQATFNEQQNQWIAKGDREILRILFSRRMTRMRPTATKAVKSMWAMP